MNHRSPIRHRQQWRKRKRCPVVRILLWPFIANQALVNTAFLDKASSFQWCPPRPHTTTIVPGQHAREISHSSKSASGTVTVLRSTLGPQTTKPTSRETDPNLVESIIPEGHPKQEYGTPVGAVVLPGHCIEAFYKKCQETVSDIKNLRFRGVENCGAWSDSIKNPVDNVSYKAIHVQTEVAASLLDGDVPSLVEFIRLNNGCFLPGVRMKRDKHNANDCSCQTLEKSSLSSTTKNTTRFTFVELFAGVGGFRLGLEPIGGSCVLASERDEMACAFYRRHFGNTMDAGGCPELVEGDILDVVASDFPPNSFDLLTAGFPCQPFSARGKKKGLDDDGHRGQMYQELVRILVEQQPSFFLFENVVGLVTMDGGRRVVPSTRVSSSEDERYSVQHTFEAGRTMDVVLDAFRSCGYKVEWHVVNCKHFCPQHRERVYFVGSRLDLNCPDVVWENIYPSEQERLPLRCFLEQDPANSPYVKGCELTDQQWEMIQRKWGRATTNNNEAADDALARVGLKIDEPSAPTLISSYKTPASLSARFVTEEADGTLRDGNPRNPRFLTPPEFRRLMGFPDTFEVTSPVQAGAGETNSNETIVDGHVYKVLGNAVVPAVIEAIGREIVRLMEEVETKERSPPRKEIKSTTTNTE